MDTNLKIYILIGAINLLQVGEWLLGHRNRSRRKLVDEHIVRVDRRPRREHCPNILRTLKGTHPESGPLRQDCERPVEALIDLLLDVDQLSSIWNLRLLIVFYCGGGTCPLIRQSTSSLIRRLRGNQAAEHRVGVVGFLLERICVHLLHLDGNVASVPGRQPTLPLHIQSLVAQGPLLALFI